MSKIFIAVGIFFIVLGIGWRFGLGRLPGDVVINRGNFTFAFPVVTSIILSIIITILLYLLFSRNR